MPAHRLFEGLRAAGFEARTVPVTRLRDLREDLASLERQGLIAQEVVDTYLRDLRYDPPEALPDARSVIVASAPQPMRRVRFAYQGTELTAVVPPTYANALQVIGAARAALEGAVGPGRGRFERAALPLKTLAARTGLARYGRNNITYVGQHGSFHRLVAFFTDLDLGRDDWQEREALPACSTCRRCLEACPAGVISPDRFLIHVERCLTFLNERPSDRSFPEEVRPDWHNAIVGCMRCQVVCPYDAKVKGWTEEGDAFTERETHLLLRGGLQGREAELLSAKLERNGLDLTIFPRNLKALLHLD